MATDYTQDANIISWWYFEDASGNLLDGSANHNDLTVDNGGTYQDTPHVQGSYSFKTTQGNYQGGYRTDSDLSSGFPGKSSGGATNNITIGGWFYLASTGMNQDLMSKYLDGNHHVYRIFHDDANTRFVGCIAPNAPYDYSWTDQASSRTNITTGTWYLVVITLDSSNNLRIYVGADGDTSTTEDGPTSANALELGYGGNFRFGADWYSGANYDEGFVLTRQLSKSEIDEILYHGLDGTRRAGVDKALADSGSGAESMTLDGTQALSESGAGYDLLSVLKNVPIWLYPGEP